LINTINFKTYISKAITLIVIALLFPSFKSSYWEFDKESRATIYNSITKIFNSSTCNVESIDDIFYSISEHDSIIGYLAVTDVPSKFHQFDYYILFDQKTEILKVEILHYRENYGAEVCNKQWLQQFIGLPTKDYAKYNRMVDGISGATLSVNNLKKDVFRLSKLLKNEITEKR
jgi:hypothetical protein